ncbi:unnamed protein product [Microthlaspi erraticum]|uniref:Protease Do-like PDZ domain-containing protein n=1 Tax=Microthlaspi erraticum TaxID=1685480 RepID=A0A6D2KLK7_9BRAS|nr:unnamed protein product [Microthlaspi erraticum]
MNLSYQTMENPDIRNYFKMSNEMTGILINQINPLSDAHKFLKKNDIILAIDGVPIGNDSTVPFRKQERVTFTHLVSMKKLCETVLLKVLRDGKEHEFNISVKPILEDDINAGYSSYEDLQVKKVNGVEVDNLKQLCQLIEECTTGYLMMDLEKEKVIVLNNKSARKATSRILKDLKITSAMSEDLQPRKLQSGRIVPRHSKKKN